MEGGILGDLYEMVIDWKLDGTGMSALFWTLNLEYGEVKEVIIHPVMN